MIFGTGLIGGKAATLVLFQYCKRIIGEKKEFKLISEVIEVFLDNMIYRKSIILVKKYKK